ncbi:hypothetical protein Emag_003865 [Eimeria magna]
MTKLPFLCGQFIASGNAKWEHRLAVISPYAQQVVLLRRTIKALLGIPEGKSCPVDVNTVDGFQRERKLLEEHAPRFLADLAESHKASRERKQKRGAKEDDEQGDELQTEGPVSWEQPIESAPDEESGTGQEMTTFHDVADEGCLDEAAIQMRDKALEDAGKVESSPADAKSKTAEKTEDTETPHGSNLS